ncbi:cobalt-zinc-cadmium efflux system protein [Nematocida sp. AWRm80]|nr:cobalt-zinc-cadmium efflux system protein [Nematocida sp. AWRm80]
MSSYMYLIVINTLLLFIIEVIGHHKSNSLSVLNEVVHIFNDLLGILITILFKHIIARYNKYTINTKGIQETQMSKVVYDRQIGQENEKRIDGVDRSLLEDGILVGSTGRDIGIRPVSHRYIDRILNRCTFGLYRLEVISSIINVILLVIPNLYLITMSIKRYYAPEKVDREIVLYVSILSIIVNIVNFYIAHKATSSSSSDISDTSVYLHALNDLIQCIGITITSLVLYINQDYVIIDVIMNIVCIVISTISCIRMIKEIIQIILEMSPVDVSEVKERMLEITHVQSVEDIRIWSLDRQQRIAMLKILIFPEESPSEILHKCKTILKQEYQISYSNIEIHVYPTYQEIH